MDMIIEECKDKGGMSAKPRKQTNLNLKAIEKKYNTIISTPIAIVIDLNGQIVIHKYGEIIFKKERDRKKIKTIAKKIYQISAHSA